jgi:aspartyl-tRNA(Asn)/glutamyl-tRNA(Gln) amidotransferase subunit C
MPQVTDQLVDHLANLSMLHFDGQAKQAIKKDLESMIGFVEKLQELDTTGVEPLRHMSFEMNKLRADELHGSIDRELALKNAANHTSEFFLVPKVLSK